MKRVLLLFTILMVSVMTTACINNLAVQELNNKAVQYLDKGDSETAICRLKSSLDLNDEMYQTHYNLAVAYNNVGNYTDAIEELKKVLELKPDFYDAIYTMAVAKEALCMQIINKEPVEDGTIPPLTNEEMSKFNDKAAEVIDLYNQYIVKKINAEDTDKINEKIQELNLLIKDFSIKMGDTEE